MKHFFTIILFLGFISSSIGQTKHSGKVIYGVKGGDAFYEALEKIKKERDPSVSKIFTQAEKEFPFMFFHLLFNEKEALYELQEMMDSDASQGFVYSKILTGGNNKTYYDLENNKRFVQKTLAGSSTLYLVEENMDSSGWEIQKETKTILGYPCIKAIREKPAFSKEFLEATPSLPEEAKHKVNKEIAWFCPSLPYQIGPGNSYGLPGLVLELSLGDNIIFYAQEVDLNPKNLIVEKPSKGKKVSEEEFKELQIKGWDLWGN